MSIMTNWELEEKERLTNISDLIETFKHAKCPIVRKIQAQTRKAERRNQIYTNILLAYTRQNKDSWWKLNCIKVSGVIVVLLIVALYVGIQIGTRIGRAKASPFPSAFFGFRSHPSHYY